MPRVSDTHPVGETQNLTTDGTKHHIADAEVRSDACISATIHSLGDSVDLGVAELEVSDDIVRPCGSAYIVETGL